MSDSQSNAFVFLCAGVVLGTLAFFKGFRVRDKKKLIENIPTSTVRGMAVGLVEVKGKAQCIDQPLISHFAKAPCVFFRYEIQELRRSGKSSRWVTIASNSSTQYFYLEDDTGKVAVDPQGAELNLRVDRQFSNTWSGQGKTELLMGLAGLGIESTGFLGISKSLRCFETYIAPGDFIYVMGHASPAISGDFSEKGHENLCIRKEKSQVFYLSDHSEKDLLKKLTGEMILMLYGGPVLAVGCLFLLMRFYLQRFF